MSNVNKVILVGHLGADPELRRTGGGQSVVNFRLATSEKFTDKDGQKQEKTEWHRIVAWGKTAELCGQYLAKGRLVMVEGKLQTREWEKEGQNHFTTEIVASNVVFLSSPKEGGRSDGAPRTTNPAPAAFERRDLPAEDEIPF